MDDAIGALLDTLEELGAAEDTLVIFFSDNGGTSSGDNRPLRGHKSHLLEGGVRVCALASGPGRIPAGSVCDEFLTSLELVPTVLAAVGLPAPPGIVLDGFDMLPTLAGGASPRTEMFWQRRGERAARVGDWKWIDSPRHGGLFHLTDDIGERHDLTGAEPERLRQVQERLAAWTMEMEAAEPRGPFRDY